MEIWYTLTGDLDKRAGQEAIRWINDELYGKPVTRLKFLVASGGGDVDTGTNLYMYLKSIPVDVETIGFGVVDAAAKEYFASSSTLPKDVFLLPQSRFEKLATQGLKYFSKAK